MYWPRATAVVLLWMKPACSPGIPVMSSANSRSLWSLLLFYLQVTQSGEYPLFNIARCLEASKHCWQHDKASSPIDYYHGLLFDQSESHPSTHRPLPAVYGTPDNTQIFCIWRWKLKRLPKYGKITIFVRGLPLKADPIRRTLPAKA